MRHGSMGRTLVLAILVVVIHAQCGDDNATGTIGAQDMPVGLDPGTGTADLVTQDDAPPEVVFSTDSGKDAEACTPTPSDDPCVICSCDADGATACTPAAVGSSCTSDNCCFSDSTCQPCTEEDDGCPDSNLSCVGIPPEDCISSNPCQTANATCSEGQCECALSPVDDGVPCASDGAECTEGDRCEAGECVPGTPMELEDGNQCTIGACIKGVVEQFPVEGTCSDSDPCTEGETCTEGNCTGGAPVECLVGPCAQSAYCDSEMGVCVQVPKEDHAACNLSNPCVVSSECIQGECVALGWVACTEDDPCKEATCNPSTGGCESASLPESSPCVLPDQCVLSAQCLGGTCSAIETQQCNDDNPCVQSVCDPTSGQCTPENLADETACTNDDACALAAWCVEGVCTTQESNDCEDNNSCTTDSCDSVSGCDNSPNELSCADDDPCTINTVCGSGSCGGGSIDGCDDGDPCTLDSCVSDQGGCIHPPDPSCMPSGYVLVPADTQDTVQVLSDECSTASETTINCESGMVAIGYRVRSGSWMDQFSLMCSSLQLDGSLTGTANTGFIGTSTGPTLNQSTCPSGQMLVGMITEHGDKIDSIQGLCHPASEVVAAASDFTQTASQLGSGGGSSTDTQLCPDGFVITGVHGKTTGPYPCGVRWICTRMVMQ